MKNVIYLLVCIVIACVFISATVTASASPCDSPLVGDHSGAPGETNCSGCHSSPVNPDQPLLHFEVESGASQYKPDSTYLIHLKINKDGHNKFGFVCTSLDASNTAAGSFSLINSNTTRLFTSGGRNYVSHTPCGADNQDSITWTYLWKAPSFGLGKIKIYMSMLVSNHDHALSGDTTYTRTLEFNGPPHHLGVGDPNSDSKKSSVIPTVFSEGFTIDFCSVSDTRLKTFNFYDFQGKLILTNSTVKPLYYQNVAESIPDGIYFLEINCDGKKQIHKLVKQ